MNVLMCPSASKNTGDPDKDLGRIEDDGSNTCPRELVGYYAEIDLCYQYLGYVIDRGDDGPGLTYTDAFDVEINYQIADIAWGAFWNIANLWKPEPDQVDGDLEACTYVTWLGDPCTVGTAGGSTHYRLREGIERFLITDINNPAGSAMAQSELPIMWDYIQAISSYETWKPDTGTLFNHIPGGSNTLYMDGHVEFHKYPGKFPASKGYAGYMAY